MVGSLKVDDNRPEGGPGFIRVTDNGKDEGDVVVEGEYEVEEDMSSARGCGLRLSVSVVSEHWKSNRLTSSGRYRRKYVGRSSVGRWS